MANLQIFDRMWSVQREIFRLHAEFGEPRNWKDTGEGVALNSRFGIVLRFEMSAYGFSGGAYSYPEGDVTAIEVVSRGEVKARIEYEGAADISQIQYEAFIPLFGASSGSPKEEPEYFKALHANETWTINGSDRSDQIEGFSETDMLFGGRANDHFMYLRPVALIDGGRGSGDLIDFYQLRGGIAFDLRDQSILRNGVETQVLRIEDVAGSTKKDTLIGNGRPNDIDGWTGNDVIRGRGGDDTVNGSFGNDTVFGGFGDDSVLGGPGNDVLDGRSGNDTLVGGGGSDRFLFRLDLDTPQTTVVQDYNHRVDASLRFHKAEVSETVADGDDTVISYNFIDSEVTHFVILKDVAPENVELLIL